MAEGVPFVRDLQRCRRKDYVEAAKEVFATVLFAVLPVWLGAVVLTLIPHVSAAQYVGEFMSSGEALLISAALVGPIVYIITKKYGELPRSLNIYFPQGWLLVILSLVICMIATVIFGVQRVHAQFVADSASAALFDTGSMQRFSGMILLLAIACLYIVTVFRNFVEDGASAEMHSETADFLKKWRKK